MEEVGPLSSSISYKLCKPESLPADNRSFQNVPWVGGAERCEDVARMDDSQLVGVPVTVSGDVHGAMKRKRRLVAMEVKAGDQSSVKRKRGRPPKSEENTPAKTAVARKKKDEEVVRKEKDEEDVCFICFDGGDLVLCDRRRCPKAYHTACIKRDESFFRSKAKWNCGWHICNSCQKDSYYMCYTCTYSLCKGCIKKTDILCVRGNKGFCTTCMKTIMLIENCKQENKDTVQVDFDDKTSWEYLFKVYWVFLKTKLSLSIDELIKAKNHGKGASRSTCKGESSDELYDANDDECYSSDGSAGILESNALKRKRTRKKSTGHESEVSKGAEKFGGDMPISFPEGTSWASKELLEFVATMKNGDTTELSQFDVQALLLEYIKKNNLRDPHRQSQINCDLTLQNIFGRPHVGHFEMLKLLDSHFLKKVDSCVKYTAQVGSVDGVSSQMDFERNNGSQLTKGKNTRRKTHRRSDDREPQTNLDECAAVDVHNINLIYLRRSLVENLFKDAEKFHDMVIGCFVRIRISEGDQKQDIYRLVQVVGTSKVAALDRNGETTTNIMLEISNIDQKEIVSIDGISNQEFTEDEGTRLQQGVKLGLVKWFTVGEIKEKATALQALRVNNWLEAEKLQLNHLHARGNDKGQRKEDCVEKLQLTLEDQQRLQKVPEVHADPNMNPSRELDENAEESNKQKGGNVQANDSSFLRTGTEVRTPRKRGSNRSRTRKTVTASRGPNNVCKRSSVDKGGAISAYERTIGPVGQQGIPSCGENGQEKHGELTGPTDGRSESRSGTVSELLTVPSSAAREPYMNENEFERFFHYRDPHGRIQGPFSMVQLRRWSTSGFFPDDLRIWKVSEEEGNSLLLTDVLNRQCTDYGASADAGTENQCMPSIGPTSSDTADIVRPRDGEAGNFTHNLKSSEGDRSPTKQPNVNVSFPCEPPSCQEVEVERMEECIFSGQNHEDLDSNRAMAVERELEQIFIDHSDMQHNSGPPSETDMRSPVSRPLPDHNFSSETTKHEATEQDEEVCCFPHLPSPPPKERNEESGAQVGLLDLLSPSFKPLNEDDCIGPPNESTHSLPSNVSLQESGTSGQVNDGAQLSEVACERKVYCPIPLKPSLEDWDSSLVHHPLLRLAEIANNQVSTPVPVAGETANSSPSYAGPDTTSCWQAILAGTSEFPLAEESVSDLLAEVDAMETLGGMPSPTSAMNCNGEAEISKMDCFSSLAGFSPSHASGKGDALSSTVDMQLSSKSALMDDPPASHSAAGNLPSPSQYKITNELYDFFEADYLDSRKKSNGHCSAVNIEMTSESVMTAEPRVEESHADDLDLWKRSGLDSSACGEASRVKPRGVSVDRLEASSEIRPSACRDMAATESSWRGRSDDTEAGWEPKQGNPNLGWGGPPHISINIGWGGGGHPVSQANPNMNWGMSSGNVAMWSGQPKYGGDRERFSGSRERGFHGGRDRSWSRQSSFGAGGGGSSRPPPKGQRVCKFYESGRCKKGAMCDYLHP